MEGGLPWGPTLCVSCIIGVLSGAGAGGGADEPHAALAQNGAGLVGTRGRAGPWKAVPVITGSSKGQPCAVPGGWQ